MDDLLSRPKYLSDERLAQFKLGADSEMDDLLRHIAALNDIINRMKGVLSIARCPNCDGSGAIQVETRSRQYVTREMAMDAENPDMEGSLYNDDEFEVQQCQWCYEKDHLLK